MSSSKLAGMNNPINQFAFADWAGLSVLNLKCGMWRLSERSHWAKGFDQLEMNWALTAFERLLLES